MAAKSAGLVAMLDGGVVTRCPQCDTDNPDLENRGFCSDCGALFRQKIDGRMTVIKVALGLGLFVTLLGPLVSLVYNLRLPGLVILLLGLVPLAFGVLANRKMAHALMDALSLRSANDTQRILRMTDYLAIGVIGYFVAASLACVGYFFNAVVPEMAFEGYQTRFEGKVNEYLALIPAEAFPAPDAQPYLSGKAIVIEKSEKGGEVSKANQFLASGIRAETPEEVGTVVLVRWEDFRTGQYDATSVAYRVDGLVKVIDVATKAFYERPEPFKGGPPPAEARSAGDHRGPKPFKEIADFVNGLKPAPPASAESPAPAEPAEPAVAPAKKEAEAKSAPDAKK